MFRYHLERHAIHAVTALERQELGRNSHYRKSPAMIALGDPGRLIIPGRRP